MTTHTISQEERLAPTARNVADWLCLAAAPTFAIMALLTGVLGGGPQDTLCASAQDASPLSGMVAMYMLMSAFHSAHWLKLISSQGSGARQSRSGARQSNSGYPTGVDRPHATGISTSGSQPCGIKSFRTKTG